MLQRFPRPRHWRAASALVAALMLMSTVVALAQTIPPPPGSSVVVNADSPQDGSVVNNGGVTFLGGWAADASANGTGIDRVEIFLDSPTGTRLGRARYGTSRPDVARSFNRPDWTDSGWALDWHPQYLAAGDHALYIVAFATSGATAMKVVGFKTDPADDGKCPPSPQCPRYTRVPDGWEVDTGGPGVFIDRRDMPSR